MWNRVLTVACLALLTSCGGGGGGGDGDQEKTACEKYCENGCERAADCGFMPDSGIEVCTNTCVDELTTEDEALCDAAQDQIGNLSCDELADLLNIRSSGADEAVQAGLSVAQTLK